MVKQRVSWPFRRLLGPSRGASESSLLLSSSESGIGVGRLPNDVPDVEPVSAMTAGEGAALTEEDGLLGVGADISYTEDCTLGGSGGRTMV